MRTLPFLFVVLALSLLALPSRRGTAGDQALLRIATLAPAGSGAGQIFRRFDQTLQQRTGGRLKTRLYGGGVAGDERDVLRKMRIGQLECATVSSVGLAQVVRSVLVLQLPGLVQSRAQLERVRRELSPEFQEQFEAAGYVLLGWGDVGERRVFSQRPLLAPSDYKRVRPWVWREDPLGSELLRLIGANGVPLALPEVFAALQTGMVDTVTATAIAAVGLQWFRFVKFMSKATGEPVIGATLVRKAWFDALAPDLREALVRTSKEVEQQLAAGVQKEDERAAEVLKGRGIREFEMRDQKEWEPLLRRLAERMVGKLYTRDLLERVVRAAQAETQ